MMQSDAGRQSVFAEALQKLEKVNQAVFQDASDTASRSAEPLATPLTITSFESFREYSKSLDQFSDQVNKAIDVLKDTGSELQNNIKSLDLPTLIGVDPSVSEFLNKLPKNKEELETVLKEQIFSIEKLSEKAKEGLLTLKDKVTEFAVNMVQSGADYAVQMRGYSAELESMLGSADAAAAKMQEIKQMAAKSPLDVGDFVNAIQILDSFQVPAQQANAVLQQLGDISLGNSERLAALSSAFGQVSQAGVLTTEQLQAFMDAGFDPLQTLAQSTGESVESLYQKMQEGSIGVDQVRQAFELATVQGGEFFRGAEEGNQTTQGLLEVLQQLVNSKIADFFQLAYEKIGECLPAIIEFVDSIDVSELIETLQGVFDTFMQKVNELSPVIAGITGAFVGFKTALFISDMIEKVKKGLGEFSEGLSFATLKQQALNLVMNMNPFMLIATLIAGVVSALINLWTTNEDFRLAVIACWESIKQGFVQAWESIKEIFAGWGEFFGGLWKSIEEAFANVFDFFCNIGGNIVNGIKEGINNAWESLTSWFTNLWNSLFNRNVNVDVKAKNSRSGYSVGAMNRLSTQNLNQMVQSAYISLMANQSYGSGMLATRVATVGATSNHMTLKTDHTATIELDGRTVGKLIAPYVDRFLF